MQTLGNFATTTDAQAPVFVAILFDAETHVPSFALIQESPTDIPIVKWGDYTLETRGLLQDATVTVTRPSDGGGIIRRTCNLEIQTEHSKGYAFFKNQLTKAMYYSGQNVQSVYFGLYAIDRQYMFQDLKDGLFLGFYQIETGVEWIEEEGKTTIPLIEILINDTTIVGATNETIPEEAFLFNPWFEGTVIPKCFGQVPRVKMLNSFPTISVKDIAGNFNGLTQASYTTGSSYIVLESNVDQGSILRQLVAAGGYVRVKMGNGEVIRGSLAYNSGDNTIRLNITHRNTYYAKTKGYTHTANGETPSNWGFDPAIQKKPAVWSIDASVLMNGKEVVQDPEGFMQATVQFYTGSSPATETANCQFTGWLDEDKGHIKHTPFTRASDPTNTTLLSFRFHMAGFTQNYQTGGSDPFYAWPPGEFLYFHGESIEVSLYFVDPDTGAQSGGSGTTWEVVGYEPGAITYESYIRNGFSRFLSSNIYAEGEGRLIRIPSGKISSITQSTTFLGMSDICKVVFTAAPIDMGIGATSNVVYIDAMYKTGTNEGRPERILYEILKESEFLSHFAGSNVNGDDYSSGTWMPYIGYVARGDENVSEVIDRICFQTGATFKWVRDKFKLRSCAFPAGTKQTVTVDGDQYIKPTIPYTDQTEMLENTAKVGMGKLNTYVDDGFERIAMYFKVEYGGWEDPFYKPARQLVTKAIKPYEREVSYKFDLINDSASAKYAVGLFLSIGHPSGASCVQRTLSTEMTMKGCRWEACDPILFKDFPMISTEDETNALLDANRHPLYPLNTGLIGGWLGHIGTGTKKDFLMGAVAVVDQVTYEFSIDQPKVSLIAKMSQLYTQANGAQIYSPPYPPAAPGTPSNNPSSPPGGSGSGGGGNGNTGGGGGHNYGGYSEPMTLSVEGDDEVEIDSTIAKTANLTVTVDPGTGAGGFSWTAAIIDDYNTGGAAITGGTSGSFANKLNDSYSPATYAMTVTVNYMWLYSRPHSMNRILTIRFTRTRDVEGQPVIDYIDHSINVTLKDLTDIEAS
jgi:hypothetical protein